MNLPTLSQYELALSVLTNFIVSK